MLPRANDGPQILSLSSSFSLQERCVCVCVLGGMEAFQVLSITCSANFQNIQPQT